MSEEPKKTNKYLTRYEDIHFKLKKVVETYLTTQEPYYFKDFILDQRMKNRTHLKNSLIEVPKGNIVDTLKEQYISKAITKGEIGTISSENQEYEIKSMALLMLMSNRLVKVYEKELDNNRAGDKVTRQRYVKNRANLLLWKDNAISDLISSIYILEKTEEYSDIFSYGESQDDRGKENFVIDLPYVGQISVHFGNKKEAILEDAKNKAMSILTRKRELGQIDENKYKEMMEQMQENDILPTYTGKLYENVSALPIEYIGTHTSKIIKEIGLDSKLPEEMEREDIQKMIERGLNEREAYYLSVKLGFPKSKLEEVIRTYEERHIPNEVQMGEKAVGITTAQERENILKYEQRNLQSYREGKNDKVVGENNVSNLYKRRICKSIYRTLGGFKICF